MNQHRYQLATLDSLLSYETLPSYLWASSLSVLNIPILKCFSKERDLYLSKIKVTALYYHHLTPLPHSTPIHL